MSATLEWKLNRLRTMGFAEVCWRVRKGVAAWLERRGVGLARDADTAAGVAASAWVADLPAGIPAAPYVEAADRVIAGRWDLFSLRDCPLGFPPRWNRDPRTGVEAPLDFGTSIDYRDERVVGDISPTLRASPKPRVACFCPGWTSVRIPGVRIGPALSNRVCAS
jgi:hypothetical protein